MIGKMICGTGLVLAMSGTFILARSTPSGYAMPFWGDRGTFASLPPLRARESEAGARSPREA